MTTVIPAPSIVGDRTQLSSGSAKPSCDYPPNTLNYQERLIIQGDTRQGDVSLVREGRGIGNGYQAKSNLLDY